MGAEMRSGRPIRVLSVEDHPVFREGLSKIICSQPDMELVSQAATGAEALREFKLHRPDVTLIDLRLPGASGTDIMITIRGEFPHARFVVLTTSEADSEIRRALQAGASAYVLKSTPKDQLLEIIRSVHAGKRHVPADVATRLAEHYGEESLTERELEILRYIRDGSKNKTIAGLLGISEATVNFHIRNIMSKLQANDRTHAVTIAIRRGMVDI